MSVTELLMRTVLSFVVLLFVSRLLGKKLISQMTFFDFVAGVTIGELTAAGVLLKDVPLSYACLGLAVFCLMSFLAGWIVMKSRKGKKLLEGEPTILIRNGEILESAMRRERMTMMDLLKLLRAKDLFYIEEVEYAILETDGSLSVLKKSEALPLTRKDINAAAADRGLPKAVVIDGRPMDGSFLSAVFDETQLRGLLRRKGIANIDDVSFAQLDDLGELHVDRKQQPGQEESIVH